MKNKKFILISGLLALALGIMGLEAGYDSPQQWRQSFAIIGFIIFLAIFITSLFVYFGRSKE
jgi:hypothetical protein